MPEKIEGMGDRKLHVASLHLGSQNHEFHAAQAGLAAKVFECTQGLGWVGSIP